MKTFAKRFFKIILILKIIMLSLFLKAAVRTVGNGGGLAEMILLSNIRQLPVIMSACSQQQINCGMNDIELKELRIIEGKENEFSKWKIIFHAEKNTKAYIRIGNFLDINSVFLYDTNERPKEVKELVAFIWTIVWMEYTGRSFEDLNALLIKVTTQYNQNIDSYSLLDYNLNSTLHFIDFFASSTRHIQNIYLENSSVTVNLNAQLSEQLGCIPDFWEILNKNTQLASVGKVQFMADMRWRCKDNRLGKWFGKLIITIPFVNTEAIVNGIAFKIIGRVRD